MLENLKQNNGDTPAGLAFALAAYFMWGFLPLFMKMLAHIPPAEVVAHRVVWSIPIAGVVLVLLKRTKDLRTALTTPHMLFMGVVTAALISVNWGVYVWAITSGHATDAALGYYINPLFSVFLGWALLKEHLEPAQKIAVGLAAIAVAVLAWQAGSIPWAALSLTVTWGFYAFFKRSLPIGPNQGFMLEILILFFPALAYILWLEIGGTGSFLASVGNTWLLLGAGVVTAGPLLIYANAAKRLRLSTIGILQYIAPTMIFLIAVFVFEEPFGKARAIAFPLIWLALVIYSVSVFRQARRRQGKVARER